MNKKDLKIINSILNEEEQMLKETGSTTVANECIIRIELLNELKSKLECNALGER